MGVDRLDYTKGLVNRLKAFEILLERHPEHRGTVNFLQISVPSRTDVLEYQQLKEEMDQLVGKKIKLLRLLSQLGRVVKNLCKFKFLKNFKKINFLRTNKWPFFNCYLVTNSLYFWMCWPE